jgi:prolyl oligopeptidase
MARPTWNPVAIVALLATLLTACVSRPAAAAEVALRPPATRVQTVNDTLHGVVVPDPYRWLEAKDSPETRAWIAEQNAYTDALLGQLPGRAAIADRLAQFLKVEMQGSPTERGGRYFYSRRHADQEQSVLYVRHGLDGKEEVLVDPHPLSPDRTTSMGFATISHDGALVAISTRQGGEDEVAISFLDVATRKPLADALPKARYFGISIDGDKRGFYYCKFGPQGPRVHYHPFGGDLAKDELLFGEGYGPEKIIGAGLTEDRRYLVLTVSHGSAAHKTEIYVQDVKAKGPIVPIVNDIEARFSSDVAGETMYLQTNWEAPNGRVLAVDLKRPAREHWMEVVPAGKGVIEGVSLAGGKIFVNVIEDVVSSVRIFDPTGRPLGTIAFPTLGSVGG